MYWQSFVTVNLRTSAKCKIQYIVPLAFYANRIATDITVNSRAYAAASDPVILQPGESYNFQLFIPANYLQGIFEYYHVSLTAITESGTKVTYKKSIPISV